MQIAQATLIQAFPIFWVLDFETETTINVGFFICNALGVCVRLCVCVCAFLSKKEKKILFYVTFQHCSTSKDLYHLNYRTRYNSWQQKAVIPEMGWTGLLGYGHMWLWGLV